MFVQKNIDSFSPQAPYSSTKVDIRTLNTNEYKNIFEGDNNELYLMTDNSDQQIYFEKKPLQAIIPSPSGRQTVLVYRFDSVTGEGLAISLLGFDRKISEIFSTEFPSWDITSDIQWLGENYLFFSRHCGTACQGLSLLDVSTGKIKNATLSYQSFPDQPLFTHFEDWFGNQFHWEGSLKQIETTSKGANNYLVFVIQDGSSENLREEKVMFRDPS
jgi:hypothetical protein